MLHIMEAGAGKRHNSPEKSQSVYINGNVRSSNTEEGYVALELQRRKYVCMDWFFTMRQFSLLKISERTLL